MNRIIRYISISIATLILGGSCSDLDQEIYSELAVDSYNFTSDDMNKLIAPAYSSFANVILGFHPALTQSICTDQVAIASNASGWDDGGVFKRMQLHTWNAEQSICHWLDYGSSADASGPGHRPLLPEFAAQCLSSNE